MELNPNHETWSIIGTLNDNIGHEAFHIRQASVETMAFIAEEVGPGQMRQNDQELMISAFIRLITPEADDELCLHALKGLYLGMEHTDKIFHSGKGQIIMDRIYSVVHHQNDKIRVFAFQSIVEIVRIHYNFISEFMEQITEQTFSSMGDPCDDVVAQVFEVWTSIAEEEIRAIEKSLANHHIIPTIFEQLISTLLDEIKKMDVNENVLEWNGTSSKFSCLRYLARVMKDSILNPIINFTGELIGSDNDELRYIGILSLGSALEGPSRERLFDELSPAFSLIMEFMVSPNEQLREIACWFVSQLCKFSPFLFSVKENFDVLNKNAHQVLEGDPANFQKLCVGYSNLFKQIGLTDTCIISPDYQNLFKMFLDYAFAGLELTNVEEMNNYIDKGFLALIDMSEIAPRDVGDQVIEILGNVYELINNSIQGEKSEKSFCIQKYLFLVYHTIFNNRLQQGMEPFGVDVANSILD